MSTFFDYIAESEVADQWLSTHTRHTVDKYPTQDIVDDLIHSYPYTKNLPVYRSVNFADEEQYRSFLDKTQHGTVLNTSTITSWSPDVHTAHQFAVTRPTFFDDEGKFSQPEDKKRKERDFLVGPAGVILKLSVPANSGIDVSKSKYTFENEIILVPGHYTISIYKTTIPYVKSIHDENYDEIIQALEDLDSGFNRQKLEHVLFRFADISDEAKEKIWGLFKFKDKIETYVDVQGSDQSEDNVVKVDYDVQDGLLYCYRILMPEHQQAIRIAIKSALQDISNKIEKLAKEKEIDLRSVRIHASPTVVLGELITGVNAFRNIDSELQQRYQTTEKESDIKSIEGLPHDEKIQAIKRFTNDLVQVLNNIQKQ